MSNTNTRTQGDILDEVEFYDLMQNYRIAPFHNQERVVKRYDEVKAFIRDSFTSNANYEQLKELAKEMRDVLLPFSKLFGELTESKVQRGGTVFKFNDAAIDVADLFNAFNTLEKANTLLS